MGKVLSIVEFLERKKTHRFMYKKENFRPPKACFHHRQLETGRLYETSISGVFRRWIDEIEGTKPELKVTDNIHPTMKNILDDIFKKPDV